MPRLPFPLDSLFCCLDFHFRCPNPFAISARACPQLRRLPSSTSILASPSRLPRISVPTKKLIWSSFDLDLQCRRRSSSGPPSTWICSADEKAHPVLLRPGSAVPTKKPIRSAFRCPPPAFRCRRISVILKMGKTKEVGISATWESTEVMLFCELCIKEIELGNRPTTHFNRDGWKNLVANFKVQTGKSYDRTQMKNKWDQLKKEWKLWKELKHGETGLGWDSEKRTIDSSNEWWEEKLKVISTAKKFRYAGLNPELEEKLDRLFSQVVATGEDAWAPSVGSLPPDMIIGEEDDNLTENSATLIGRNVEVGGATSTNIGNASTSMDKRRKIGKKKDWPYHTYTN